MRYLDVLDDHPELGVALAIVLAVLIIGGSVVGTLVANAHIRADCVARHLPLARSYSDSLQVRTTCDAAAR